MCTPSSQWPLSSALERDGVVEIAGVDRVDRDDREGSVRSRRPRPIDSSNLLGLLAGVGEHIVGELARQVELVDDRHRVDARLAARAEHFDDHAFAVADVRREADHFDDDFVVGLHAFCAGVADVDRVGEEFAVDLHHAHAGLLEVDADEAVGGPLDDVDDAAFLLAHPAALRFEAHGDDVAAGGVAAFYRPG